MENVDWFFMGLAIGWFSALFAAIAIINYYQNKQDENI